MLLHSLSFVDFREPPKNRKIKKFWPSSEKSRLSRLDLLLIYHKIIIFEQNSLSQFWQNIIVVSQLIFQSSNHQFFFTNIGINIYQVHILVRKFKCGFGKFWSTTKRPAPSTYLPISIALHSPNFGWQRGIYTGGQTCKNYYISFMIGIRGYC